MCGGQILSSPDKSRGKRNEVSERAPSAEGDQGLGQGDDLGIKGLRELRCDKSPDKVGIRITKDAKPFFFLKRELERSGADWPEEAFAAP